MKIWTCGSSLWSGSQNAWRRIKNVKGANLLEQLLEFFRHDRNDFLSRLVTMDETWLYHWPGDKATINGSGGIAAHPIPKNSECKNPLEKFSPQFFGIKMASSSLIIFQRAKLSMWSITYLCWCSWRTFWRNNAAGRSPRVSCSCTTMPRLTGHLQPTRNWRTWASNVLNTHPILWIWPCWTTTCSLNWKTIERSSFFIRCGCHCCRGDLLNFIWVACKS